MTTKELWITAEQKACRLFQSKRTPGSGNGVIKSDCRQVSGKGNLVDGYRTEVKSTIHPDKITLQWKWFEKIIEEALAVDQVPSLYFYLGDHSGYAIVPWAFTDKDSFRSKDLICFGNNLSKVVTKADLESKLYILSANCIVKKPKNHQIFLWEIIVDDGIKTIDPL